MNRHAVTSLFVAALLASGVTFAQPASDPVRPPDREETRSLTKEDLTPPDIRKIQSALNEAGYNAGSVDGVWGVATTRALRDFQRARGLEANGQLDEASVLALGFSRDQFAYAMPPPALEPGDVRQVQEALNQAGYQVGAVDGRWGPGTAEALRQFQRARGLEPTGKLNHDTVLALGLSVSDFAAGEFDRGDEERGTDSVKR